MPLTFGTDSLPKERTWSAAWSSFDVRRRRDRHRPLGSSTYYLGLRRDGKAQFNIYNLQLGSTAIIDNDYFERAVRLCDGCVERVATWAGAQGEIST